MCKRRFAAFLGKCLAVLCLLLVAGQAWAASAAQLEIRIFWSEGCPHCERALAFLDRLEATQPNVSVLRYEVSANDENRQLFLAVARHHRISELAVPMIVLADHHWLGYRDDASTGAAIAQAVSACLRAGCPSLVTPAESNETHPVGIGSLHLPLWGEVDLQVLSLPALTVVLAAADGFNPCAMWVLVFLLGLLTGVDVRWRRWLLGGAFIMASALVYYLIMAAWLNTLQLFAAVVWIRMGIGLVALLAGGTLLFASLRGKAAVCPASTSPVRRKVLDTLRELALSPRLFWALTGIVLLAFAVNIVELLCSAGIPAVYTQLLALQSLPVWHYHAYLLLYVLVFMLDDLLLFFAAMLALEITGLGTRYARISRVLGGSVLLIIGGMMILKPDWLM